MHVDALQSALLAWADRERRDLPWRRTRDPWAILVSELMLQQTQVPRVVPKFAVFMARFPTPTVCAAAPRSEVVEAWAGLGYNRRAVNLHRAAAQVAELHGGAMPDQLEDLLALPGVGPYTARAVLVFAYERDIGVVDTNVARILARWSGRTMSARELQALADDLVPAGSAWLWNQALFDLGASVCRARTPECARCCVRELCCWRGEVGVDPAVPPTRQSRFDGSDRQGRGRLVDALRHGPVTGDELAAAMGWPADPERAARVADTVIADGLAVRDATGQFHLPG